MKTSLKLASPKFSLVAPQKWGLENLGRGGCSPPIASLARTPLLTKLKRISSSLSNYVVLTF